MTKQMIVIHNAVTGEIIEREMTSDELAQFEKDKIEDATRAAEQAAKDADKAALLAKLGITADEAKLLLG
jgi:phosphopantetheinyl transferase (holo-ACP synthase)